jgi:transcriptional regulator with XRE-family HTH domain
MNLVRIHYIEDERKKLNLRREQFSAFCSISRATYDNMIKHGTASLKTLDNIAKFLMVDIALLLEKTIHIDDGSAITKDRVAGG